MLNFIWIDPIINFKMDQSLILSSYDMPDHCRLWFPNASLGITSQG